MDDLGYFAPMDVFVVNVVVVCFGENGLDLGVVFRLRGRLDPQWVRRFVSGVVPIHIPNIMY